MFRYLKWICVFFMLAGCGVKSDPVPPGTPAEIGRGRPSFRGADKVESAPLANPKKQTDEDDDNQ